MKIKKPFRGSQSSRARTYNSYYSATLSTLDLRAHNNTDIWASKCTQAPEDQQTHKHSDIEPSSSFTRASSVDTRARAGSYLDRTARQISRAGSSWVGGGRQAATVAASVGSVGPAVVPRVSASLERPTRCRSERAGAQEARANARRTPAHSALKWP